MPVLSMFYGIVIYMYAFDNRRHHRPHFHAEYGEFSTVVAIDDGEVLEGDLPKAKMKLVQAWGDSPGRLGSGLEPRHPRPAAPAHQATRLRKTMDKVIRVLPESSGQVFVEMADGRCGIFDVTHYMRGEFFGELKDEAYFRQVRLFFRGIGWPHGQDLGPDTIAAELVEADATTAV